MPSFDFSYEYDRAGNRTKKIDNLTSEVTTYTYDSANQLISMEEPGGTTTFEWDAAGNLIAKHAPDGTTTFTWDYEDQLTQVAPPVGDPVNFTYNAMGQRIQKGNTRFIYDGVQLLQETDLSNQTLRTNTFTNEGYGDLVSEHDGTDSSFPTFDGQSSIDAIVDDTATVTDRFGYTAFGGEDSHTGSSTTPFRFVGKQSYYRDAETGLYLLGAGGNPYGAGRYYDPSLGRFISRDPIGLAGGDVNLYRYAGNNPVNSTDPLGLDSMWDLWGVWDYIGPTPATPEEMKLECERRMKRRARWLREHIFNHHPAHQVERYCRGSCQTVTFLIALGHSCERQNLGFWTGGHTGVAVGEKYWDFGPFPHWQSLWKEVTGFYWWDAKVKGEPETTDLVDVLKWLKLKENKGYNTILSFQICVPRKCGEKLEESWNEVYEGIETFNIKFSLPGKHCTSLACYNWERANGLAVVLRPYLTPIGFAEYLASLKHTCGKNLEGKSIDVDVIQRETLPPI